MKIVLRENVHKLGTRGDVVEVKPGFARNFLIPRELAYEATSDNLGRLAREQRQYTQRLAEMKESAIELQRKLKRTTLTIEAKAAGDGTLYGSVSARDLFDAYQREGIELDMRAIILEEHIKETGRFTHKIHLHPELDDLECEFWVVPEG